MDLNQKLQEFQQKYVALGEQSSQGSLERHVYTQIAQFISSAQNVTPAKQRAFETQISLMSLAQTLDPPSERHIVCKAVEELEAFADLPPSR